MKTIALGLTENSFMIFLYVKYCYTKNSGFFSKLVLMLYSFVCFKECLYNPVYVKNKRYERFFNILLKMYDMPNHIFLAL